MRLATLIRWAGPAAIANGVFMIFSDLLGLTIYVPGLGEAAQTGYQAVGSGVILFGLVLLLVGMVGLHARNAEPGRARVIEYGDGHARYVLVEPEEPRSMKPAGELVLGSERYASRAVRTRGAATRRHRAARETRRM
jgi:hypothetical protein